MHQNPLVVIPLLTGAKSGRTLCRNSRGPGAKNQQDQDCHGQNPKARLKCDECVISPPLGHPIQLMIFQDECEVTEVAIKGSPPGGAQTGRS